MSASSRRLWAAKQAARHDGLAARPLPDANRPVVREPKETDEGRAEQEAEWARDRDREMTERAYWENERNGIVSPCQCHRGPAGHVCSWCTDS